MNSIPFSNAHPITREQQPVTKQSTPHNCNYGLPQPFQGFAVTERRNPQVQNALPRHCEPKAWQSTNAKLGCSYTLYPTPYTLILAFLLTLAPLAHSAWDGSADTTWYTDSSSKTNFTITTAEQLAGLSRLVRGATDSNKNYTMSGKTITLGGDIALAAQVQWIPIGKSSARAFNGTFDGAGHKITGVSTTNRDSTWIGLFGYTGSSSVIKNVGVIGSVVGKNNVGILVGSGGGTIRNSYVQGSVMSMETIKTNTCYAGGLAGGYSGVILNSYSRATTVICSNGGGASGLTGGSGSVINSYYDSTTSKLSDLGKGIPKSTTEMQSPEIANALNMGASIAGDNAWIHEEGAYPTLSSEIAPALTIANYFESGDGSSESPYIITTKTHLENLAKLTNAGYSFQDEFLSLGQDIELNDTTGWEEWGDETEGLSQWTPIGGSSKAPFKGSFDGAGHTIRGLYINTTFNYQGLFGYASRAVIKNVGVIAGYVKGGDYTGFLAGYNAVVVIGGVSVASIISNSYATGNVSGANRVGGLVGYNSDCTISNSYATGNVSGTGYYVGGLVGGNIGSKAIIGNSYAVGNVEGSNNLGGLVGYSSGTISNSYAAGSVEGNSILGGLVGYNSSGTIRNSYYNVEKSAQNGLGIPKTTEEMQSERFTDLLNLGSSALGTNAWTYNKGNYPTLSDNPVAIGTDYFAGGNGTESNPYIITTKTHLENLAFFTNAGYSFESEYFSLGANIELNDTAGWSSWGESTSKDKWTPIGTEANKFSGIFDGAGHTICGLYISTGSSYQGLFGNVGSGATLKNIGVVGGYVKGGSYTGFLAGGNDGEISGSYATGNVSGTSYVGGLAGFGEISGSYATGNVSGTSYVGGLVGSGTISNSYAAGNVSGTNDVGGLAGSGMVSNSYYDTQTSGQSDDGKGTPKTTAEMKRQNSFEDWDFDDTWFIYGDNYPKLLSFSFSFADGDGTDGNPYIIAAKKHLENLALLTNAGNSFYGKYILLVNDIALNDTAGWNDWNENTAKDKWTPIGTSGKTFNGTFDGAGHTIRGLYISASDSRYQGLFGYNNGAVIKNVGVIAGYVKGGRYTGFLTGYNNAGTIEYSYAAGNVSGDTVTGGLAGYNNAGTIKYSYAAGNVSGDTATGGLAGYNYGSSAKISNSYATGSVSGNRYVGGLVGYNYNGTISNSYAAGNVSGTGNYVGGLAGYNYYNTISNSYATGNVSGTGNYLGGLAGSNSYGTISSSYAAGNVSGTGDYLGGLVGYNRDNGAIISNSYAIGNVSGETNSSYVGGLAGGNYNSKIEYSYAAGKASGKSSVGGLVGAPLGSSVSDSYYDSSVNGSSGSQGTPKTTADMKLQATFENWNFADIWGIDTGINSGMPHFQWEYVIHADISISDQKYNKAKICPEPLVSLRENALAANADFTFNCDGFENINVSDGGSVKVIGSGYIKGEKTADFNIIKIDTAFKDSAINVTYAPGLTLGNIELSENYTWEKPDTLLNAGNEQTFHAAYTSPSGNYNIASGEIVVNVAKADTAFKDSAIGVTYAPGLTLDDVELSANYAWETSAVSLDAGNGQTFPATYESPSGNYNIASGDIVVDVAKADTIFNYSAISVTYVQGLTLAGIELSDNYAWDVPATSLNAGDNQPFPAAYTSSSGNYKTANGDIVVNVAKAQVAIPQASTQFTYSGTEQVAVADGDLYSATDNAKTNAGTYDAILSLDDPDNYEWEDGTIENIEISFTIAKADGIGEVSIENWAYGETAKAPSASSATNPNLLTIKYAGTSNSATVYDTADAPPAEAGTYSVIATFEENSNYKELKVIIPFSVERAEGICSVTMENFMVGKTPSQPLPMSATNGISNVTYSYRSSTGENFSNIPSNQGSYTVTATFAQTANYNQCAATYDFEITANETEPLNVTWTDETTFVYNKMVQGPRPKIDSRDDIELTVTNLQSEAGIYEGSTAARAFLPSVYQQYYHLTNETKSFEILQAPLDVIFEDKGISEIEGIILSANGTDPDTLYVDAALVADSSALRDTLARMLGYRGFKTDTTTKQSDDKSVLSGTPQISFPSWDYPWSPSSSQILAKRVSTSVKATAVVSAESVTAKNYEVNDKEILVLAREEGDEDDAPVSPMGYCKVASSGCAYVSSFICSAFNGVSVETCEATPLANTPIPYTQTPIPTYFNLQGQPLGSVKPKTPGIYIEKTILGVRKIAVK